MNPPTRRHVSIAGRLAAAAIVGLALAGGLRPAAVAATADPQADAQRRIASERSAAEARFRQQERACRERFVVMSCIDDAKRERRRTIDRLRSEQVTIDATRRHERAELRRAALQQKAAEEATRGAASDSSAASAASGDAGLGTLQVRRRRPPEARRFIPETGAAREPKAAHGLRPPADRASPAVSADERRAKEARNRAAFEERQREAAKHRAEVVDRTTRQMLQHTQAAPLPVPRAASAALPARPGPRR
ncbi:MAG: hypothetical protein ABI641_00740 [Caldimonas sp.]